MEHIWTSIMEPTDIVVKAKYHKITRRFRTQTWSLTLQGLQDAICSLFNFPLETQLFLTYIDENGDTVTLVDTGDLHDIMKQRLNPLRITVELPPQPYVPLPPPVPVHCGISCDGCGAYPITGPRFKSKVKVNYDLCSLCYPGNTNDYIRMDYPLDMKSSTSLQFGSQNQSLQFGSQNQAPPAPQPMPLVMIDCRLIKHVNFPDGTVIAPSTSFTKTWRMRNSGAVIWDKDTRFAWVGGSRLCNKSSVDLQIPSSGVLLDQELDISVDFTSPSRPGRYTSNWIMISSSGLTFGERVWVDIQVQEKTPLKITIHWSHSVPPVVGSSINTDSSRIDIPPVVGSSINTDSSRTDVPPVVGSSINTDSSRTDVPPVVGSSVNTDSSRTDVLPAVGSSINTDSSRTDDAKKTVDIETRLDLRPYLSHPTVDLRPYAPLPTSVLHWFDSPYPLSPPPPAPSECEAKLGDDEAEERLHQDLNVTRFKNEEQNKEAFEKNEYDPEKPVDYLSDSEDEDEDEDEGDEDDRDLYDDDDEWDPLLAELEEMGFHDTDVNKTVLKENKGSIKGAVMDLIAQKKLN